MNMFAKSNATNVAELLTTSPEDKRAEFMRIHAMLLKWTKVKNPQLWGKIIGYGRYTYHYPSGRSGDWMQVGLACGKNYFSIYICEPTNGEYSAENHALKLGKGVSVGRSCIRFKNLDSVNLSVLEKLIKAVKINELD